MEYIVNKLEEFAASNNVNPVDHAIISGNDVGLIFRDLQTTSGWHSPANAKITVPAGKKLVFTRVLPDNALQRDTGYRFARLHDTTDDLTVVGQVQFQFPGPVDRDGDSEDGAVFPEVAAGHTVELQIYNSPALNAPRRAGAIAIGKLVAI